MKSGLAADGNSRLILRGQTHKPGAVSFSGYNDIGAKLESLSRKELSASVNYPSLRLWGLPSSSTLAFTLSGLLGLYYVRNKLGRPLKIITWDLAGDYLVALAVIDIAVMVYRFVWPYDVSSGIMIRSLWVLGVIALCAGVYAGVTLLKKFEEWQLLRQAFRKK